MSYRDAPIGSVFDIYNGATPSSGEETYWDGDIPWITPADLGRLENRTVSLGSRSISAEGYANCGTQLVPEGSIILSTRAPIGHLAITENALCFNQGCRGLVPHAALDKYFAFWALTSCKPNLEAAGQGTTFVELSRNKLRAERIPLPDIATQKAIADFLDRETARIDQLIEKKQVQLELLLEKQAARLDARTFSAAADSKWDRVPFKWLCRIPSGQIDPKDSESSQLPLIAPNHIESGTGRILLLETAAEQEASSGKYAYPAETVLYSKIRPALAKGCKALLAGLCSADMYPIVPSSRLLPRYLLMQLLSRSFTDWAVLESMRVAMPKINRETLGSFRLIVPPIEVQGDLVQAWLIEVARAETTLDAVRQSIERLKELRSALITAGVTGQIDITEWDKRGVTVRQLEAVEAMA